MDDRVLFTPAVICGDFSSDGEEDFDSPVLFQNFYREYEDMYVDFVKPRDEEILLHITKAIPYS